MIEDEEAIFDIKRNVRCLAMMPLDVYYNDSEAHAQINLISSLIWQMRNSNWYDKKAIEDRRYKEYSERMRIDPIIGLAKLMGLKEE